MHSFAFPGMFGERLEVIVACLGSVWGVFGGCFGDVLGMFWGCFGTCFGTCFVEVVQLI